MKARSLLALFAMHASLACAHRALPAAPTSPSPTDAAPAPSAGYDAQLTAYPYPFEVRVRRFSAQQQPLEMAYMDVAPAQPNGRTVLLLHGKNFSGAYWERTIRALSERGYRVVVPDQIGFGKSSKPGTYQYSFAQLAHNTRALLDSLQLQRCSVIGHSMGGMLAVRFALLYPATTERLVLVNPIGLEDYALSFPYRTVDQWFADELKQTPETIREYQRNAYYGGAWKPEYDAPMQLVAGFTRHAEYSRVAWVNALTTDMIITQPVVNDLPRLRVPTRLIIGTRDRTALGRKYALPQTAAAMGDYTALGPRARDAIPNSQLFELAGVGHVPQVESFPRYRDILLKALH